MLDIVQWLQETKEQLTGERWIPKIQDEIDAVESEQEKWGCQVQQQFQNTSLEIQQKLDSEIQEGLTAQEQLSRIYAQVNYALSLTRIKEISPIVCQTFDNSSVKELSSEKIGKLLEKTVESAKKLGNQPAEIYALGYYGQWYEKMHEFLEAQKQTEEALAIAQSLRLWDIAYQWQWQLGRIHKAKGETQNALAAYDAAFNTIQSLRDELLSAESDVQFAFRDRVEPIYREYVSLLLQRGLADEQTNLNKARKIISDLQLAELQNLLRCRFAELERNKTVPVEDVIAQEENAAIIYPIILKDGLEVILSLPKLPLRHYSPPNSTQQEVEVTLKQLRYSLEQPFFSKQGKEASKKLYEWLIRPLKTDLDSNQIKTLIFVLDGSLRNIPMAALYDGNQYLVKNYAIALAPGLKLPKSEPKKQFKALIAGLSEKPEFENSQDNEFGPLEYVETEVRNIEPLLKNAEVLRNKNFTSKALQEKINSSSYNVVHLATHGQFGFSRENTFIITASAEPRQYISAVNADKVDLNELDDVLQARDNDLIELLVLSACETATGDDREVLGIAGMAVQTGARSTLASLWNIDDPSTAELMKQFYTALVQQGKTKAEALRKAQEYLLDNSSVYKPSHWAPYVLVGDWR
jgi:CHAT domain-containing protein